MRNIVEVIDELVVLADKFTNQSRKARAKPSLMAIRSSCVFSAPELIIERWGHLAGVVQHILPAPGCEFTEDELQFLMKFLDKTDREAVIETYSLTIVELPKDFNENYPKQTSFVCPSCGVVGFFGSFQFHEAIRGNPDYKDLEASRGDTVSYCTADQHVHNGCKYHWVRGVEVDKKHFLKI